MAGDVITPLTGLDPRAAIGIFDSGVGGLTVFRRVAERLPQEDILYLGDTARVPYGTKSADTVARYARSCANLLLARGIKLLLVACNTASAYALDALRASLEIPVIGVVEPGASCAAARTATGRIGVIGTSGTIKSGIYPRVITRLRPQSEVFCRPCPLFVPLAEEGWTEGPVPESVAQAYLAELLEKNIDTLVLGCTHYPLLKGVIGKVAGPGVALVDSAEAVSEAAERLLDESGLRYPETGISNRVPVRHFMVSDSPSTFTPMAERFLGVEVGDVEWVDC